jgi:hypothetical protein
MVGKEPGVSRSRRGIEGSRMPKYNVYAKATASQYVGQFEAESPEAAENLAAKKAYMSICHHCSQDIELGDIDEFEVELVEEEK